MIGAAAVAATSSPVIVDEANKLACVAFALSSPVEVLAVSSTAAAAAAVAVAVAVVVAVAVAGAVAGCEVIARKGGCTCSTRHTLPALASETKR